jgi:hypothetical protein
MFGRRSNRSLAITLLVALLPCPRAARAYVAIVNKTDHSEIHVVPPPGKVVIDGKLDDWDLSGAITMFIDEASKASYSVRGAMMYDKEFLYVGARVKDPTPMMNNYSFGGEASKAWDADAIQIFLVSNPDLKSNASLQTGGRMSPEDQQFVTTFWLWYSTQDKAPGFFSLRTLQYQNPTLNPPGVEKAIVKDEDGKGYTMEYRIPWKVLRTPREIVPGDTMQCQWQLMWGNDRGTATRCGMTDVRRGTSGDLGYMGPSSWGTAIFEKEGNLKLVEKSSSGSRADGFIPVAFTLDKPAKVSLAICNAEGRLIRTGLGAQPYPAGPQTWMWDGLDDADKPVPAGSYTAKILTHDGIGQKFVCDVGVSGTPPYQTEDGTGGWAGDYRYPQTMAIDGDCVILGTAIAEASQPTIRTDLDGRKKFGTAVAGHAVALHKGFGYTLSAGGARITKFSLENGMLAPFTTGRPETAVPGMRPGESGQDWAARSWQLHGIAAVGDQLVVSSLTDDKLFLLDLASGAPRGEAALPKPYGLAVGPGGGLYAVSGKAVGRYDLKAQQFTAFAENLEEPKHLAVDGAGNVYVSLHGKTMQVWKIAPDGKVLLKYGIAGGRPEVGKFNPAGMLKPWNVAVDKNGRLWVAEADSQPKRYSVWNPDGTLWKEFFGSMDYSTTAYLDPAKPEFIYAQCVRYRVDYDKGTWYPDATILRKRDEAGVPLGAPDAHGGAVIRTVKGRTFFLVGSLGLTIYEQVGDAYVPRLASFTATKEKIPLGKDGKPNPKAKPRPTKVPSLWVDDDNDGQVEPEEVRETDAPWTYMWTPCVDAEMNLYQPIGNRWAAQGGAKTTQPYGIARWTFQGFNDKGGLVYGKVTDVATDPDGGAVAEAIPDATNGSMVALVSGGSLERGQRPQGSGHRVSRRPLRLRLDRRRLHPGPPDRGHGLRPRHHAGLGGRDRLLRPVLPPRQAGRPVRRRPRRGPAERLQARPAHGAHRELQWHDVPASAERQDLLPRRRRRPPALGTDRPRHDEAAEPAGDGRTRAGRQGRGRVEAKLPRRADRRRQEDGQTAAAEEGRGRRHVRRVAGQPAIDDLHGGQPHRPGPARLRRPEPPRPLPGERRVALRQHADRPAAALQERRRGGGEPRHRSGEAAGPRAEPAADEAGRRADHRRPHGCRRSRGHAVSLRDDRKGKAQHVQRGDEEFGQGHARRRRGVDRAAGKCQRPEGRLRGRGGDPVEGPRHRAEARPGPERRPRRDLWERRRHEERDPLPVERQEPRGVDQQRHPERDPHPPEPVGRVDAGVAVAAARCRPVMDVQTGSLHTVATRQAAFRRVPLCGSRVHRQSAATRFPCRCLPAGRVDPPPAAM